MGKSAAASKLERSVAWWRGSSSLLGSPRINSFPAIPLGLKDIAVNEAIPGGGKLAMLHIMYCTLGLPSTMAIFLLAPMLQEFARRRVARKHASPSLLTIHPPNIYANKHLDSSPNNNHAKYTHIC
ncbi:predicted protein [Coccidioides posadasii str. Silveira]|uniref:Predicted protein n=1 Tax=Coccidioides posadasii (strain RMSCC 757 / Silveira) TaxID=443226 RepID=E9CWX5_COCPS|nr:predicted protein [Coccidioides posadasii str. Silveira]